MCDGSGRNGNNKRMIITVLAVRMQCFRIPLAHRGILGKVQNERHSPLFRYQPRKGVATSTRRSHLGIFERNGVNLFQHARTWGVYALPSLCATRTSPEIRGDDGRRFRDQPVPVTRDRHEEQTTRSSLCTQLPLFGVNPKRTPNCRGCFYFRDSA